MSLSVTLFVLFIVRCLQVATGTFESETVLEAEVVTVEFRQNPRARRSDVNEELNLEVYSRSRGNIRINLKQNNDIHTNVPITVFRQGRPIQHNVPETEIVTFYQGTDSFASFLVTENTTDNKKRMFGHFELGNDSFQLEFDHNNKAYTIRKLRQRQSGKKLPFGGNNYLADLENTFDGNSRTKRGSKTLYEVESLVVVDYSVYQYWLGKVPTNVQSVVLRDKEAKQKIRQYYAFLINSVNLRFRSIYDRDYKIDVLFSGIHIADRQSDSTWTETEKRHTSRGIQVDSDTVLDNFHTWCNQHTTTLTTHDVAMLFTMYDLTSNKSDGNISTTTAVLGIAYKPGACTKYGQALIEESIAEDVSTVVAHELGHSLGSDHDGYSNGNGCPVTDGYIMTPILDRRNKSVDKLMRMWIFSNCSKSSMEFNMIDLDISGQNCLLVRSNMKNIYDDYVCDLEGQIYDPDVQCANQYGTGSYFNSGQYYKDPSHICKMMKCVLPYVSDYYYYTRDTLPFDGTTCGINQVCHSGHCVPDIRAHTRNDSTCLFGDQKTYVTGSTMTCHEELHRTVYFCNTFQPNCCETCKQLKLRCVSSCAGLADGLYQSCMGCDVFASCYNHILYDNRWCGPQQVWDDDKKACNTVSHTCY